MNLHYDDKYYMEVALKEAQKAFEMDEIPIGAVLVYQGKIIAKAHNLTMQLHDPTAHAEMIVISSVMSELQLKTLEECTLYVTLEPCPMCASAMHWSCLGKLVYATPDQKRGYSLFTPNLLHPKTQVEHGMLQEEAQLLLKKFFQSKRTL